MNGLIASAVAGAESEMDALQLAIETFEVADLSELDVLAPTISVSLCSSTCSASCG